MKFITTILLLLIPSLSLAQAPWQAEAEQAALDANCAHDEAYTNKQTAESKFSELQSVRAEAVRLLTLYEAENGPQPSAQMYMNNGDNNRNAGISLFNQGTSYYNVGQQSYCYGTGYLGEGKYFEAYNEFDAAITAYNLAAPKYSESNTSFEAAISLYNSVIVACQGT